MKVIIFAGGIGSRLWPLSRKNTPKQFEKILGNKSTLQLAVDRLQPDFSWNDIYISTGKQYVKAVEGQLSTLPKNHVIGEPVRRDVGPAVGLITAIMNMESSDEPMVILWSDHLVKNDKHFRKILLTAGKLVKKKAEKIIFVAQKPRFASENLGWINYGEKVFSKDGLSFHSFEGFKYRPNTQKAEEYFLSGHHGWNLGYFVTTPKFLWELFEKHVPATSKKISEIADKWGTKNFEEKLEEIYPKLEKINFDNAILEKLTKNDALVVCENIEWSDIGAWEALKEALEKSKEENVTRGNIILENTKDSLIFNNKDKQSVVTIDLENMIVVNTEDVLLVCPKSSVGKIKKFVENLEGTKHEHLA